jgi:CBS domain containing-hemolysin-like protein
MESSILFDVLGLVAVVILVLINGFFVAAEFSLVSVRRTRIAELVEKGEKDAEAVQQAIDRPDQVIAATQLGITLASLALGWIGEPALSHLLYPLIDLFPMEIQSEVSHTISMILSFSIITYAHVVIGELSPKSIALQNPEKTSLFVAKPILIAEKIFKPAIQALNGTGNALLKLFGVKPASGHELVHSIEELKMLVTASAESGVFQKEESEMLHAVFNFGELIVRQVMIPRTEIIAAEADSDLEEIINLISETNYTKIPVYEGDLDNILGIVHIKDILKTMRENNCQNCRGRDLIREVLYIPETTSVNALLRDFRDKRQHMAVVLDEYGGTAGLVTLEDLLEEIVGEVSGPFDLVTPEIQRLPDGSVMIDGLALIETVNEELDLHLKDPYYDTIAGYVLGKLDRIPKLHDVIEEDGIRMEIVEMDGMRIARLKLILLKNRKEEKEEPLDK